MDRLFRMLKQIFNLPKCVAGFVYTERGKSTKDTVCHLSTHTITYLHVHTHAQTHTHNGCHVRCVYGRPTNIANLSS